MNVKRVLRLKLRSNLKRNRSKSFKNCNKNRKDCKLSRNTSRTEAKIKTVSETQTQE
mgnify:CR=1 FL=1